MPESRKPIFYDPRRPPPFVIVDARQAQAERMLTQADVEESFSPETKALMSAPVVLRVIKGGKGEPRADGTARAAKVFGLIALGVFLLALFGSAGCSSTPPRPSMTRQVCLNNCQIMQLQCLVRTHGSGDPDMAAFVCDAQRSGCTMLCPQEERSWR